ncbi:MAG: hypothetical protein RL701_5779, partial [Pseudomonadota bacterium]
MGRSSFWTAFAAALHLGCIACSSKQAKSDAELTANHEADHDAKSVPPDRPGLADRMQVYLNLQNVLHLADVDSHGLFIDFGTPARAKYTLGQWKTGWGPDGAEGATTYTEAVDSDARVFLPLASSEPFTLRVRIKRQGTTTLQPFLNNEPLAYVALDQGRGFADYDFAVPEGVGKAGENQLLLRFGEFERATGDEPFAWVDFIRVVPNTPAAGSGSADVLADSKATQPLYEGMLQDLAIGGYKRKAITVSAPTTLTFYFEVPASAKLSLRAGSPSTGVPGEGVRASVRVTPEGGRTTELWRGPLGNAWLVQQLPLDAFAGRIVKLELSATGQGSAGFAAPMVMAPDPPAAPALRTPKNTIIVLVDTLRADRLHPYNPQSRVRTPAFDAFAAQGAVFSATQSPENWTKPAVASVLTGLYPMSHGAKTGDSQLADEAVLVSEVFKQAHF